MPNNSPGDCRFFVLLFQLVQEAVFHLCLLEAQPAVVLGMCVWGVVYVYV